jgi:DNA invertase Pin-like site-specific DNA recombinase
MIATERTSATTDHVRQTRASATSDRIVSPKLHANHLDRLAVVYVRQSTAAQVIEHRESTEMQYNLRHRAAALGWPRDRVIVIDEDQGQSGSSAEHRLGFQRLMAEVSLNHVGIILGIEMSRLARSNKDWHQLLELCAIFRTLLADQDGLYDPADYNDRLLLGLKGTMSEAELHILRNRLQQGKRNKAERGELYANVPRGFVKSVAGEVTLDPDEEVQSVIRMFFEKFTALGSARKLLRWLLDNDVRIPVRLASGPQRGELRWTRPSPGAVYKMLHHPIYAGAYSYGRCQVDPRAKVPGRAGSGRVHVPMEQWQVLKKDHLPGYITWESYLANLRLLTQNTFRLTARGAAREGAALLGGVIRCGRCSRRMSVVYSDPQQRGRYVCYAADPRDRCQSVQAADVDQLVEQQVLRALEPAAVELSLAAHCEIANERSRLNVHWQQRIQRAKYHVERAERQYRTVEPENRLVARELEKSWDNALREQQEVQEQYARFQQEHTLSMTDEDRAEIEAIAASVPTLWNAATTTCEQRKTIVRHLIDDVSIHVQGNSEVVDIGITWAGGFESRHQFRRSVHRYELMRDYDRLRSRLIDMRDSGKTTKEIAQALNNEGFHTARGKKFESITVQTLLFRNELTGNAVRADKCRFPETNRWSIPQLVEKLGVPTTTICHWCRRGWLHAVKTASNRWLIWADKKEVARLKKLLAYQRSNPSVEYPTELTTANPLDE